MAIRIVYRGVRPDELPLRCRCINCKSVMEFLLPDAKIVNDRNETLLVVKCQVCGSDVYTSREDARKMAVTAEENSHIDPY